MVALLLLLSNLFLTAFLGFLLAILPPSSIFAKYATVYAAQKNGTDVAWLNGMMNVILEEGLEDKEYINERCTGFEK